MNGSIFVTISENIFGPIWKSGMQEWTRKEATANQREETLWYLVNDQSYFKTTDPRCDTLINHTYKTFSYFISMQALTKP